MRGALARLSAAAALTRRPTASHHPHHSSWHPPAAAAAAARSFTSLPVIDVAPLVSAGTADEAAVAATARQLHQACRDVGFFYVRNTGVPADVSEGVLRLAREWFQLPEPVKRQLLLTPGSAYRGYQPMATNVTRHEGGFTPDLHEALDFYREEDPAAVQAAGRPPSPVHGRNPWPHQVPGFVEVLQRYIACCQSLGSALLHGIALGLGLPGDAFAGDFAADPYWVTRVIHYPPLQASDEHQEAAAACGEVSRQVQLSCGEHTDYGLLTLVNQDAHVSALQVKNAAGEWVDAPPLPDTFVCNIGDCFQVLTNGQYTPTLHRVVNSSRGSAGGGARPARVSVPFFYEPAFEAVVQPLPQLCRDAPPRFAPLRYGSHLESKVLSNFEGL